MTERVYFTVRICDGGLADVLSSYIVLRKLGLSLGYVYCHSRFGQTRPPLWHYHLPHRVRNAWRLLRGRSTYDFIGLNQYFACDKTLPDVNSFPKKLCHTIVWSDRFLERNRISSYDSLVQHIQSIVSRESTPGSLLLLVFERRQPMGLKKILNTIPEPADVLNFRAMYFQQRKKQPQRSKFARERLKILAHLRLGDRAVVHMPWGIWMYRSYHWRTPLKWEQSHRERDYPELTVADFYQFMRGLLGHFPPDTIDAQIYSDGFGRIMKTVCRRKREREGQSDRFVPPLCLAERRLLRQDLKYQGRLLRQLLKGLPNSTCFIGEKKSQLFSLIHAAVEADLVITAFPLQHNLITQLMRLYATQEVQPAFLLLHKPDAMSGNDAWVAGLKSNLLANFSAQGMFGIFVDISAPDFPALTQQIMRQWKSGTRTVDHN